ncbi:hypothetical protein B7494_g1078 [Chlorociboria aeruginascens]|nr:hypothetical protein B7494_g1078 [Chlorociboria aeruginascens]
MFGIFTGTILGIVLIVGLQSYHRFCRNVELAKKTGFPYITGPIFPIEYHWILIIGILEPLLHKLPFADKWEWLSLANHNASWVHLREKHEKFGDTFVVAAVNMVYLKTSNAEMIAQVVARKADFPKPLDAYKVVTMFGKSMIATEGQDWRHHKKIVGPSFSEKSNKLVFEESLRQAESMMAFWASKGSNTLQDITVENTAIDTATLSLHVICAAGFGMPQLWPESSPMKMHRDVYQGFAETKAYFEELMEIKKKQIAQGERADGTMDLMGVMMKTSNEIPDFQTDLQRKFTKEDIMSNAFIFLFAGHETTANSIHFCLLELAIDLRVQKLLRADIDNIIGPDKPTSELSYQVDMPRLYNSMVGAVMNEQLRLIPAIPNIPKTAAGDQTIWVDGKAHMIPDGTFVHMNVVGTDRNPRYWPHSPSKITGKRHDLDDFVPERWLPSKNNNSAAENKEEVHDDGLERASFEILTSTSLYKPPKGAFIVFSEGARSCPGMRFAQVEITAVLTMIFQKYSVELDVSEWASDEQIERMSIGEKRAVYERATMRAREVITNCEQTITLQMKTGDKVPLRFIKRGVERFADVF